MEYIIILMGISILEIGRMIALMEKEFICFPMVF